MRNMTIGDAADASGVKVTTIRFYEDRGLLAAPPRTPSGQRTYDTTAIARLSFIRHARDLGFSLDDISALLAMADTPDMNCAAADSLARQHLDRVTRRIAQLMGLQAELTRMIATCDGRAVGTCQVIETLADHALCHADHAGSDRADIDGAL